MTNKNKTKAPYKCDNGKNKGIPDRLKHGDRSTKSLLDRWFLDWFKSLLERMGIMSPDSNCRFPWLVPWPIGTKIKCCPKKNDLPVMNPLETKCIYKPLVKTGQIWIHMVRGTTIPKWAHIERCVGKPCHN